MLSHHGQVLRGVGGSVIKPGTQKGMLWKRQQGLCCWCGKEMGTLSVSVEHIIPRSFGYKNGGTGHYDNKALAHKLCNSLRSIDVMQPPHPDRIFDFVRQRLLAGRKYWIERKPVEQMVTDPKPKKIPLGLRIDWSLIILRPTPQGWVGMAGSMRKSGRARVLRVTPPYRNRITALTHISGAIR